ncbi:hypothetical protein D3C87_1447120 [compost metagenome]
MAGYQHRQQHGQPARVARGQQQLPLEQQRHDDGDGPERAHARVVHDGQHVLAPVAAAEGIHAIGQAILMERTGQQQRGDHAQRHGHGGAPQGQRAPGDQRAGHAHQQPHQRKVARRRVEEVRLETDPAGQPLRQRHAREVAEGGQEEAQFVGHGRVFRGPIRPRRGSRRHR